MTADPRPTLEAFVHDRSDSRGRAWIETAVEEAATAGVSRERLATLSAMAARRLGRAPGAAPAPVLETAHGPVSLVAWSPGDAGRALLVLAAEAGRRAGRCRELFRLGDEGERVSLVRALAVMVDDDGLRDVALAAGRTNSADLFGALSQHNPYPTSVYDEHALNQLVLKALFMSLPITTVAGLEKRLNPELSRMCADYVEERRAAGRAIPEDIWHALVPRMDARGRAQATAALADPAPAQRRHAALALLAWHPGDEALMRAVAGLLERETDPAVRGAVEARRQRTLT